MMTFTNRQKKLKCIVIKGDYYMEDWKTLYEKQIQKFDNIDKYIFKNLKRKKYI